MHTGCDSWTMAQSALSLSLSLTKQKDSLSHTRRVQSFITAWAWIVIHMNLSFFLASQCLSIFLQAQKCDLTYLMFIAYESHWPMCLSKGAAFTLPFWLDTWLFPSHTHTDWWICRDCTRSFLSFFSLSLTERALFFYSSELHLLLHSSVHRAGRSHTSLSGHTLRQRRKYFP